MVTITGHNGYINELLQLQADDHWSTGNRCRVKQKCFGGTFGDF